MATLKRRLPALLIVGVFAFSCAQSAQDRGAYSDEEFGPVVRAYLGYLRNVQEVVLDRASPHEISASYYRRNSTRIKALPQMAIRLARESSNDYLPELEAVAGHEFRMLFGSSPPQISTLKTGQVVRNTFRYLGMVRSGETFYVFARLEPYDQAEIADTTDSNSQPSAHTFLTYAYH